MIDEMLARIPGTAQWVQAKMTPKVQQRLRVELRKLERAADARATVLWMATSDVGEVIAWTGDVHALPRRFRLMHTTVPSHEELVLDGGERVDAIVQVVQLGQDLPRLRAAAIIPGPLDSSLLYDLIERCAERLERIAVDAL